LYQIGEPVPSYGLYRCTTCGLMIPLNAGEKLPACPTGCVGPIWTFYNEKSAPASGEVREVTESFSALDLNGDPRAIPAGAWLAGVDVGPRYRDERNADPSLAAFHFDGRVYFGSAQELFRKSKVIQA